MKTDFINELGVMFTENNSISDDIYNKLNVKRGLRNKNGTGVLVGLTKIGSVLGYSIDKDGKKIPADGKLYYRGIPIEKLVALFKKEKTFCFEKTIFLLLFGKVPSNFELKMFISTLKEYQHLPDEFIEDFILRKPSTDIMNQLQRSVLCLYTLDENPDDVSLSNLIDQSLNLIAKFPSLLVYCYQACNYKHFNKSLIIHNPVEKYSIAQNVLHMLRSDNQFTELEAEVLDLILVIHAEHGGGNNSTFTSHVVSSTRTDTYSSISASIGSLKGPMHGGANSMVTKMVEDIKKNTNPYDEVKLKEYLKKIFNKEAFDKKGRIYGMGHAVYTISDPRAVLLKKKAYELAKEKNALEEFELFSNIEKLTKEIGKETKGKNFEICANVDLYSGFVYKLLNIPQNIFTPLFALARIASWNAHRMEQILVDKKLIRPAYKAIDEDGNVLL
ncbi:MAG: citrate/2-methylcitrate synthase [Leptotrichia wadei]|uniref:citrate/2-methylcitrate synthase n=1 Tax=Leptotrichia wadei TaxID=157687 RepID=UPI0026F35114|nr:citrate/2-methylcitrate synthase [Leptotrichia wadei]MBS6018679.1 citrate/2-methylcitrate synthase [Leptotrichia wadei]